MEGRCGEHAVSQDSYRLHAMIEIGIRAVIEVQILQKMSHETHRYSHLR